MVAGRGTRPFSLDAKLDHLDSYLPPGRKIVEMRLLAVERDHRHTSICCRLIGQIARIFMEQGFDLAVISGSVLQLRLYKHFGFVPFGPIVGATEAQFQPMFMTLTTFQLNARALSRQNAVEGFTRGNYLPGPVEVQGEVRKAFELPAISHRSEEFMLAFRAAKRLLCELTSARRVEILPGSGTLANDAVCAQLSLLGQPGLILSNGEFGERLFDHAVSQNLDFEPLQAGWGDAFEYEELRRRLEQRPSLAWIWGVHCETSTGVLNDLDALKTVAKARCVHLCLDCISSIGAVPVNLNGVYLASCVSGKAIASYSGLSMVFYNHEINSSGKQLPRYLDLGYYAEQRGVPFTYSSNLVFGLKSALAHTCWQDKYQRIADTSVCVRKHLTQVGVTIVASDSNASPAVVTIALPHNLSSKMIGRNLMRAGYLLSYNSEYLLKRNWIQICIMGEWSLDNLEKLLAVFEELYARRSE
jgi:aspartate aminotransferase-like enzyme